METKGKLVVEHSLVLPKHTDAEISSIVAPQPATLIFNDTTKELTMRSSSAWKPLAFKDYVDLAISQNQLKSMPVVFTEVIPDNTVVMRFVANTDMFFTTANSNNRARVTTAPSGGPMVCRVLRNTVEVGRLTLVDGEDSGLAIFFADTTYVPGDVFALETGVMNGATDLSINFQFQV